MSLPEGTYYNVEVGFSDDFNRDVYLIRNNETKVIEYEHPMLGQIREVFKVLEENERAYASGDKIVDIREVNMPDMGKTQQH